LGELPPLITLTASPLTATVGQAVTYTASASSPNGIATYEWDLDGNGSFETNTGTTPTVTDSYPSATSPTVSVRVTDTHGLSDVASVAVQVNAPAPTTTPTTTTTPTPPPGGHPIGPGSAPPSVTGYAIANAVFRVGRAITPMTGQAAKAVATGTKFTYRLSEGAVTKIALLQLAPGRKKGRACVKLTAKVTAGKTCIRAIPEGTLTRTSHAGANAVAFTGRLGGHALTPGRYRAVLTATDSAGNASKPKTLTFKVVGH
ncbi:MAG: PKD domain-containing protein, partial [Actinomycetota bacterium]|nr:PKD domain-containing protein [Actinomycetota bacterium]